MNENDQPTENVQYFTALSDAQSAAYRMYSVEGAKSWLRIGSQYSPSIDIPQGFMYSFLGIVRVSIFGGVENISDVAFKDAKNLKYFTATNVASIGDGVCSGLSPSVSASSLAEIVISGETEITIGNAFTNCLNVERVEVTAPIVKSTVSFLDGTFRDCAKLAYANVSGAYRIGQNTFENCTALREVILPTTPMAAIATYAFYNCWLLEEINIPAIEETIGNEAFYGCTNLRRITINMPENSVDSAPWGATNANVIWTG